MAMYHLSVKYVSRGQGRSAVGAAAYRSGKKLYNDYDGLTHDFTAKKGIIHSEIILPDNAPDDYYDRQSLWNAVEKAEKRSDARTAREIEVALPLELNQQQQIELVRDYIRSNFTNSGMGADFSIHSGKHKHDIDTRHEEAQADKIIAFDNPHAHILLTTRPIGRNGLSAKKNRNWDKRQNVTKWREQWEQIQNKKFERLGMKSRVDHRSNKDRGLIQEPTIHEGEQVRQLEKSGVKTKIGDINREIKRRNQEKIQINQDLRNEQRRNQELTEAEKRFAEEKQEIQDEQKTAKLRLETIEKNQEKQRAENFNVAENSSTYRYKKSEILQDKTNIETKTGGINRETKQKQETQDDQKTVNPQPETIEKKQRNGKSTDNIINDVIDSVNHNVSENNATFHPKTPDVKKHGEPQPAKTEQHPSQKANESDPKPKTEEKQPRERSTGGESKVPITDRFNKEQEKAQKQWDNTFGKDIDKTNITHAEKRDIFGNVIASYHKAPAEEIPNQSKNPTIGQLQEEKAKLEIEKLKLDIAERRQRLQEYEQQRPKETMRENNNTRVTEPPPSQTKADANREIPTRENLQQQRTNPNEPIREKDNRETKSPLRPEKDTPLRPEREVQLRPERPANEKPPLRPERPIGLRPEQGKTYQEPNR